TGGTANPDIGTVFDAIGDEWFTDIVCPYTDTTNLVELEEQLKNRYGPLKQIEGKAYLARSATHANLVTAGQARNSYLTVCPGVKGMPNPPYEIAAVFGAVAAFNLQNDPARPLQTLELRGLLAPKLRDRFTLEENNILLHNGIATLGYGADGTVLIQRAITGYRVNNAGAADVSYLDVETLATVAYLRYDIRNSVQLRFPRYKLADDGTNFAPGQPVVTPVIIRSFLLSRFKLWEEAGLTENFAQFEQELLVERDPNDANRVNAGIPANVVNQFRVFAALLDFLL
ncbi:MAG: phage tail protein, partial [Alphaproteobacteria bacterium]|nr:phage tail protein [Alphaproteobacteria bacterium]